MESNSTAFLIKIKLRHSLGRPSRSDFVQSEISWINDHKTIFAGLEKKKEYAILDLEDRFLRKTSGEDLYRESYDPVHRERARQEQEKIRRRREQNYRKAQQNLEAGRRTIQGQRR